MQLSAQQLACAEACLDPSRRIFAVSGQAGTGKTTLIQYIAAKLDESNTLYRVAAPTGKAAKRIREATGLQAVTVHKLLEYGRPGERDKDTGEALDTTTPRRGWDNPFAEEVIIVDEYSMITHELNRNLIDALKRPNGRIIMFGDASQLPPVEKYVIQNAKGSPFKEHMARTNASFVLEEVFRQSEGSGILIAATNVRKGIMPRRSDDFQLKFTDDPVNVLRDLVLEAENEGVSYKAITNQILTPIKTRWIGTGPLNGMLQNLLNPDGRDPLPLLRYTWDEKNPVTIAVGDKVVCTENTYDMRDYHSRFSNWLDNGKPDVASFIPTPETKYMLNGETGVVSEIYPDGGFEIDFGDRVVEIPVQYEEWWEKKGIIIDQFPQRQIDLAYALTTHKSQGSEYQNVIYVINSSIFFMLSRENFYTAITRARKRTTVITDQRALQTSLRNTQELIDKRKQANKGSLIG